VANNRNRVIKKHAEIRVSYGSRTNLYLATYYGFALSHNDYDSYPFRLVVDDKLAKSAGLTHGVLVKHITDVEKEQEFVSLNGYVISTDLITAPFRAKMNKLDNRLLVHLRGSMYNQYLKDHPGKKKQKLTLSVPFDLSYEITVVKRFIDIFIVLQLTYKRSDIDDQKLLDFGNLSDSERAIVTCELAWKRILQEQINMGKIMLEILKTIKSHPDKPFRKVYMTKVSGADKTSGSIVELRIKLRNYLKRLMLSPFVKSTN
jgi:hypothetical protein